MLHRIANEDHPGAPHGQLFQIIDPLWLQCSHACTSCQDPRAACDPRPMLTEPHSVHVTLTHASPLALFFLVSNTLTS